MDLFLLRTGSNPEASSSLHELSSETTFWELDLMGSFSRFSSAIPEFKPVCLQPGKMLSTVAVRKGEYSDTEEKLTVPVFPKGLFVNLLLFPQC